jgi:large subunit ribosomal protein L4
MRDYTQAMPKKMRRAALRSALSVKASDAEIVVVDELKLDAPKTKLMAAALTSLVGTDSALVLIPNMESTVDVVRATNNLPDAKILLANYLNIRDLLKYDKVVLPLAAIDTIKSYLG